jgi:pimeloyl-ACP methyl ester carboxylesterase
VQVQVLKTSPRALAQSALARSSRVDVGTTASWTVPGSGPRILFVHGFRGDHHGLMAIAGALQDYQVVVPDLPGYGKTPELSGEHDLAGYGAWLVDFVNQSGPYDLVLGHSFGTLVVAAASAQGLNLKTILLNPITTRASARGSGAQKLAEGYYRAAERSPSLLASAVVVRGMSVLLTKTANLSTRSFIHEQHAKHFSSYRSPRVAIEGFRAASTGSVLDYQDHLHQELLLIAGEQDVVAPLENTRRLGALLPNSQLEVIAKVGHLTHYETPDQVAAMIEGFVKR